MALPRFFEVGSFDVGAEVDKSLSWLKIKERLRVRVGCLNSWRAWVPRGGWYCESADGGSYKMSAPFARVVASCVRVASETCHDKHQTFKTYTVTSVASLLELGARLVAHGAFLPPTPGYHHTPIITTLKQGGKPATPVTPAGAPGGCLRNAWERFDALVVSLFCVELALKHEE